MIRACNKRLFNFRFHTQCGSADIIRIYRDFPVSKDFKPEFFCGAIKNITAFFAQTYFPGKEYNSHTIPAERWQVYAHLNAFIEKEFMGGLNKNTRAIACIIFTATCATVLHIFKHG